MSSDSRPNRVRFVAFLVAAFAFRLFYGLSMPFWFEDERQVYLIGLRSFARGLWPYFGADVVWTGGQLPGALQGMLIRWPLSIWPVPEAPVVLLNLLSFSALAFFAWYLCRRLPDVPRWLVWCALFTLPWTLNFSTHVTNVSYVLPGAIAFFVGFFEATPALSRRILPFSLAWFLMGLGLLFVVQIHMSWVLLPPYVAVAALAVAFGRSPSSPAPRGRAIPIASLSFVGGAAVTGWLLVPTLLRYGIGAASAAGALEFHAQSPWGILTTAARVLSFSSFEINRFLGQSRAERLLLLLHTPSMVPFVALAGIAGVVQPIWMVVSFFKRAQADDTGWRHVRVLMVATIALVYVDYFFSVRGPQAHAFYVVFPVSALFAATCWQVWARANPGRWRGWERIAAAVIVAGVVMHAGLAIDRWPRASLYTHRDVVAAAIEQRNDRFIGDRRDTVIEQVDHRPRALDAVAEPDAFLAAQPEHDLQVSTATWRRGPFDVSTFDVSLTNRSAITAWSDVRYETSYAGAQGEVLATRQGVLKHILEPGETRVWTDLADDFAPAGTTSATIAIIGGERAIPARRR